MTLNDTLENWHNLKRQKRRQILQAVIDAIDYDLDYPDELMMDIIGVAADYEADDYFGTEGLKV